MSEIKKKQTNKDQLFFHDLINQTHGVMLYLSNKHSLDNSEIESLKAEIKLLQNLIQNHYRMEHKNLVAQNNVNENANQKIALAINKLIGIYFSQRENTFTISSSGACGGDLDFIVLYRILNNIIKNMAEAKIHKGAFGLEFSHVGLSLSTTNSIVDQNTSSNRDGLGLLSIASLASEAGGFFQYEIHQNTWKNLVFLPYKTSAAIKKIAA